MEESLSAAVAENANEVTASETENGGASEQATASTDNQTLLQTVSGTEEKAADVGQPEAVDSEGKTDEQKIADVAPEQYEEFKTPEGLNYNPAVIDRFKGVAKELNLSQDKAQKLLDEMSPVIAQQQISRIQEISEGWKDQTLKDPEIGGEKWTRAQSDIARVRDKFAVDANGNIDADIAEFMQSPAGNHPGVLKLLARVGRAFGEGDFPKGTPDNEYRPTAADFYNQSKRG